MPFGKTYICKGILLKKIKIKINSIEFNRWPTANGQSSCGVASLEVKRPQAMP